MPRPVTTAGPGSLPAMISGWRLWLLDLLTSPSAHSLDRPVGRRYVALDSTQDSLDRQRAVDHGGVTVARIFISYRRGDTSGYAGRLHDALGARFGDAEVFRDTSDLAAGLDFAEALD